MKVKFCVFRIYSFLRWAGGDVAARRDFNWQAASAQYGNASPAGPT
jgi:hypothetical protein